MPTLCQALCTHLPPLKLQGNLEANVQSFPEEEIETWTRMGDTQREEWGQDSHPAVLCIALGGAGPSALDVCCGCVYGHGRTCPRGTNRLWPTLRVMPCLVNHASGKSQAPH